MKRRDFIKSALTVAALSPLAKLSAEESPKDKKTPNTSTQPGNVVPLSSSLLGFGLMRLPRVKDTKTDEIDIGEEKHHNYHRGIDASHRHASEHLYSKCVAA